MCLLSLGLARHIRIKNDVFRKYFSGSDGNFDYKVAGRLGEALGTSPKFWLDLQSKQDLNIYLQKNPLLAKYFDNWSPPKKADRTLHHYNSTPIHPGSILEKNFIQPSGIAILYWADFFCMNPRSLQRILSGKNLLDLKFISLLAKAFNTKASYWIELQNEYLSHQYFKQHSSKLKIEPIKPGIIIRRTHNPLLPGQILINRFLKPMNIPISEFTRHIGVNKNAVKHLTTGHNNIDLSLAVKLSQALGTTPMYWLDLQMKYDFSRIHTHGNQCESTKIQNYEKQK